MVLLGRQRFIEIYITQNGVGVTGRHLANLTIYFTRNMVACTDPLTLNEIGGGLYVLSYTPSAEGHDFFQIVDGGTGDRFTNAEEIYSASSLLGTTSVVSLTQDTGGTGALKPPVPDPTNWTLYVYNSSDWQSGNTDTSQALGSTQFDANGNWLTTPLYVVHGTYNIVIRNGSGSVQVIRSFLQV